MPCGDSTQGDMGSKMLRGKAHIKQGCAFVVPHEAKKNVRGGRKDSCGDCDRVVFCHKKVDAKQNQGKKEKTRAIT
jgi:hypothetical protein